MKSAPYGISALREHRKHQAGRPAADEIRLSDIPPDASMEEGIVLGCWDGEAFVSWEKWLLSRPVQVTEEESGA
jgi:hypothetical protein